MLALHTSSRALSRIVAPVLLASAMAAPALGQNVTVKNDCLVDGGSLNICPCFASGEEAAVWLTAPCNGFIVEVQILWRSTLQNQPQSLEEAIYIYNGGDGSTFPNPGAIMQNVDGTDAILEGPVLTDGFLNAFPWMDEQQTIPLRVPVTAGQRFVVSLEFFNENDGNTSAASIGSDVHSNTAQCPHPQCQSGKNAVKVGGAVWFNACSLGVSGDWVIRAVVECDAGTTPGACCLPNGQCTPNITQSNCQGQGGTYQGPGSTCAGANCPQPPTGACCTSSGCQVVTAAQCSTLGGNYRGNGTTCRGTTCDGACCFSSSQTCQTVSQSFCAAFGGTFQGAGTSCATFVCFPMGACCLENGNCSAGPMSPAACAALGGTFSGHNSTCATAGCTPPLGACCASGTSCPGNVTQATCNAVGGTWAGPNTSCATPFICPYCPGDVTHNGAVNTDDLLLLLGQWGTCVNCPADIHPTPYGNNSVNTDDLLLMLGSWGICQ